MPHDSFFFSTSLLSLLSSQLTGACWVTFSSCHHTLLRLLLPANTHTHTRHTEFILMPSGYCVYLEIPYSDTIDTVVMSQPLIMKLVVDYYDPITALPEIWIQKQQKQQMLNLGNNKHHFNSDIITVFCYNEDNVDDNYNNNSTKLISY